MVKICLFCKRLSFHRGVSGKARRISLPGGGYEVIETSPLKPPVLGCSKGFWTISTLVSLSDLRKLMATAITCPELKIDFDELAKYSGDK